MKITWTAVTAGRTFGTGSNEAVRPGPGGRATLLHFRGFPRASKPSWFVGAIEAVQELEGPAVFAHAKPLDPALVSDCASGASFAGGAGTVQYTWFRVPQVAQYRTMAWQTPTQFSSVDVPKANLGGGDGGNPAASNESASLGLTLSDSWFIVNHGTGATTFPRDNGIRMSFDAPRDLPGGFLVRYSGPGFPVVYLKNDGSWTPLLTTSGGRYVTGYAIDRTNANALVWVEGTGLAPSSNSVLYTSPLATTAAGLIPRRVTAFDDPSARGGPFIIAAHGMVLNDVSTTRALLTRLSDGASWAIAPEPGMGFGNPLWVDDNYVYLITGKRYDNDVVESQTMLRIDRATLGAPTIPAR
jgi:hypothetical protein